jgi:membrane carboxypeptidase/penicillin-binding protein PbpC
MTITITLEGELAQRLQRQAEARRLSVQEWAILVLGQAPDRPAQAEAWRELNARRFELIRQRHQGGLTQAEEAELAELQDMADKWLEPVDRRRLEMLQPFEEMTHRLTDPCNG